MNVFADPKSGSSRWLHLSAIGAVLGAMLACNAVLGIGEAELICTEGGCEDAGVFTGNAQPGDPDEGVPGRGDGLGDAGPGDEASTPASPDISELPAGSNATPPGGGTQIDGDNSGSGSDNSGSSGSDNSGSSGSDNSGSSGSGSEGNAGAAGTGGTGSGNDDDEPPPPPPPPPSLCQGRATGEVFCSGTTRISCGAGGSVAQSTPCASAAHCAQATGAACAVCLGTEVSCEADLLVSCNATRTGFDTRRCPSAALCDAATNTCGVAACSPGQSRCRGAALERCNATQTGFDPVADCGSPQACDATAGACNVCTPGVRRCLNANTLATCDATGQSETIAGCGLLEACTGGQCVPLGIPLL